MTRHKRHTVISAIMARQNYATICVITRTKRRAVICAIVTRKRRVKKAIMRKCAK